MEQSIPILKYMRTVLDDHTIPLEDIGTGMIEAVWLIDMINVTVEENKKNGTL